MWFLSFSVFLHPEKHCTRITVVIMRLSIFFLCTIKNHPFMSFYPDINNRTWKAKGGFMDFMWRRIFSIEKNLTS